MPGCMKPMSSPMMKRMLGFCCCCAAAGALVTIAEAIAASEPSQRFRMMLIDFSIAWCRYRHLSITRMFGLCCEHAGSYCHGGKRHLLEWTLVLMDIAAPERGPEQADGVCHSCFSD